MRREDSVMHEGVRSHRWYKVDILLDWGRKTYNVRLDDVEHVLDALGRLAAASPVVAAPAPPAPGGKKGAAAAAAAAGRDGGVSACWYTYRRTIALTREAVLKTLSLELSTTLDEDAVKVQRKCRRLALRAFRA